MNAEKKPLRMVRGDDKSRSGWYASDGKWHCVACGRYDVSLEDTRIPKGEAVFYAGIGGLMYCLKHAPGDAVYAPAHVEGT